MLVIVFQPWSAEVRYLQKQLTNLFVQRDLLITLIAGPFRIPPAPMSCDQASMAGFFFSLLLLPSARQLTHAACRMHEWLIRERQPRGSCRSRHIHESLRRETAAGVPSTARQCRREVSVVVTTQTYKPSFATLMTLHPELPPKFLHTNGWSMQPWTC